MCFFFDVHTANDSVHWQVVSSATSSQHENIKSEAIRHNQDRKTQRKVSVSAERVMDALRSGVFLLCVLLPVCSAETFFTHPHICYFLDAFLTLYCIIATGLFFRESLPPYL
ncbi:hypothetical protein F7725_002292 [Dissostichus mawsoni]|uniref:Uncharacterized protein n=1 Tax=Dissostichus mawsoni TaxID=36200 RepID=A0A7J5Y313_DISMA|nr:hypothetical protein F7725_002292 [Dissostichus mawsoni]